MHLELRLRGLQMPLEVIAKAIPDFFAPKLEELGRVFEARVTEVLRSYQQQADQLIEAVRKAAAELFDVPYRAPSSSEAFAMERQPYSESSPSGRPASSHNKQSQPNSSPADNPNPVGLCRREKTVRSPILLPAPASKHLGGCWLEDMGPFCVLDRLIQEAPGSKSARAENSHTPGPRR